MGCEDLETALEKNLSASSSNEMYELELSITNNVTDTLTPIQFTATVKRLIVDEDTVLTEPSPVKVSEENERYRVDLNLEVGKTDFYTPVDFTASVTRTNEWQIREDSKVIGIWTLYEMTVDSIFQNVSQFPTDYEFYADKSYSKIETNTVSGESTYKGGSWSYTSSTDVSGDLVLKMMGQTTNVSVTYDHAGFIVPLDGFMMWGYNSDGKVITEVLQKIEATDSTLFVEPESYFSLSSVGGGIEGYTEPELLDIPILLPNEVGANYEVAATFVPSADLNEGTVLATLIGDSLKAVNVKSSIILSESLIDTTSNALLSISSVGGTVEGYTVVEMLDIPIDLANTVGAMYEVSGSFVPGFDYEEGNLLATLADARYATLNLNIPIRIRMKKTDD
ncbi:MAG: hypothetical protein CMG71_04120 [Candidatus Marinimicrobia bacterium]|nr:hypothetical protein [Candidatus Neomarinimicrobiota bacterium]